MQIVSEYSNLNKFNPYINRTFRSNPNSIKLAFQNNDFFVNIRGFGKNKDWADIVLKCADKASQMMRNGKSSDTVLREISKDVKHANSFCIDCDKYFHSGLLRTHRKDYTKGSWGDTPIVTPVVGKYSKYKKRLLDTINDPLKNPFPEISLSKVFLCNDKYYNKTLNMYLTRKIAKIIHGSTNKVNNALDRVGGLYFNLNRNFISHPENVTEENMNTINKYTATIRWVLAHSTPWERGSDAISNIFMRALYKSMGIKTYPLKKGVSLDLEAYCTPLKDFIERFPEYFERNPEVIMD